MAVNFPAGAVRNALLKRVGVRRETAIAIARDLAGACHQHDSGRSRLTEEVRSPSLCDRVRDAPYTEIVEKM